MWIIMEGSSDSNGRILTRKGRERVPYSLINDKTQAAGGEDGGGVSDGGMPTLECSDISLRQWLDNPERTVDAIECLHIFSQVVDIVNLAHSQGIVVHNTRPSCFIMSSLNRVSFIESASCSDSSSDSLDYGENCQIPEFEGSDPPLFLPQNRARNKMGLQDSEVVRIASQMGSETSCLQSFSGSDAIVNEQGREKKLSFPMKQILLMEANWYTSPEDVDDGSCASDIYQLGVLLFELFCTFGSPDEKSSTMASLRHRVLPPQLLLKWPKEASFCLWLLHPDPGSRPKISELLNSEFLNAPRDAFEEREAAIDIRDKIEEQELLLEFLLLLQLKKQDSSDSLKETISLLSSDIEEVKTMQEDLKLKPDFNLEDSSTSGSRKRIRQNVLEDSIHTEDEHQSEALSKNSRLISNFQKLESAYFLTRRRAVRPINRHLPVNSEGKGSISMTEKSSISNPSFKAQKHHGWVNTFLEGLCKYLSFSKLNVKANLKQGDLLNSSNLVCSLSFDRDGEFFATAGINRKIKVFEYNSILNDDRDIHYPVVEMSSRSKLSSICWNGYIKSQIASSNFEGVVQVWDATRNQVFMEMREHERRVWSVDFSITDPTMLASGSDDGSVKLWNINQGASVGTIKTKANVCCVQFPIDSSRSLAFGSADHRIYYYDLRNSKIPICTLIGHNKTVSYIKFVDSTTLVSASTDNTLKLWDLTMCNGRVVDTPMQSFTGHVNVKNFVGLSVSEGYIATGSETNEVFVYHKAFPMPALSYKFNSKNPLSGDETDDTAQFISSVCWRGQSSTLVAANSMGNIKLLEMA